MCIILVKQRFPGREGKSKAKKHSSFHSKAKLRQATHTNTPREHCETIGDMIGESMTGNLISQKLKGGVTLQKGALQLRIINPAKGCSGARGCTWMKDSMSPEKSLWLYWEQGLAFRTRIDLPDGILGNTYSALHCETMASLHACNKRALHFHAHTHMQCTQVCCFMNRDM